MRTPDVVRGAPADEIGNSGASGRPEGGATDATDGAVPVGKPPVLVSRHAAVFEAIEEALIQPQLAQGAGPLDIISVIVFNDYSAIEVFQVPFSEAREHCQRVQRTFPPRSHGNYISALGALGSVLSQPLRVEAPLGAVNVLFFSDGRPSDPMTGGKSDLVNRIVSFLLTSCSATAQALPSTFKFHAIGFGGAEVARDEFAVLQAMAQAFEAFYGMGCMGFFHNSGLKLGQLKHTITSFSASVTETRYTSSLAGPQRALRPVRFANRHPHHTMAFAGNGALPLSEATGAFQHAPGHEAADSDWYVYPRAIRYHAQPSLATNWEQEEGEFTLHVSRLAFAAGGERNVFRARFDGSQFQWVAKECKHIIEGGAEAEIAFHKQSLVTQATCAAWAGEFNSAIEELGLQYLPAVEVNRCYLVSTMDRGVNRPLFVEPLIHGQFIKWNSNCGDCFSWRAPESEEDSEVGSPGLRYGDDESPRADDVPQAFSHWTYSASRRTRMVCDLQGFYAHGRLVIVDPAIHSAGADRPNGGYGRTDRSTKGMADFFATHVCNRLCARLGLTTTPHAASLRDAEWHRRTANRRLCVICEDQPRQVRFRCGHACACNSCAQLVRDRDNLCPTCRSPLGDDEFAPVGERQTTYVRG